jgi:acyl carrier protein
MTTILLSAQLEAQLLELWRELLGRPSVTATDNFFEIGGNSLLAARIATVLANRFGHTLTPADILAYPTVRSLADKLGGIATVSGPAATENRAAQQRLAFSRKPVRSRE